MLGRVAKYPFEQFIFGLEAFLDLLSVGNCGKAVEVKRSKKNQSREDLRRSRDDLRSSREDLSEEGKSLLESEDELDKMDVLNPEPEIRSVSDAMRPEPTQYDR